MICNEATSTRRQVFRARKPSSLYNESLRLLARRGQPVPGSHIERNWTQGYVEGDAVEAA